MSFFIRDNQKIKININDFVSTTVSEADFNFAFNSNGKTITLQAPSNLLENYTYTFPNKQGLENQILFLNENKHLDFSNYTNSSLNIILNIRNESGSTLVKGTPVYISGYSPIENIPLVNIAQSESNITMPCIGIIKDDLTNNTNGEIIQIGKLKIDTSNLDAVLGNELYISTNGIITKNKPINENDIIQCIGIMGEKDITNGFILINTISYTNNLDFQINKIENNVLDINNNISNIVLTDSNLDISSFGNINLITPNGKLFINDIDYLTNNDTSIIETNITNLENNYTNINNNVGQINTDINLINGKITTLESSNTNINNNVGQINTDIGQINTNLSSINGKITTLESSNTNINNNVGQINTSINQLNTNNDLINGKITTLESSNTNINTNIETINTNITGINGKITVLETSNTNINTSIDAINSNISNVVLTNSNLDISSFGNINLNTTNGKLFINEIEYTINNGSNVSGDTSGIETDITNLENSVSSINGKITVLEASNTNINTNIETINTNITSINGKITVLEISNTNINTNIDTINTNITGINGKITVLEASNTNINTISSSLNDKIALINSNTSNIVLSNSNLNISSYDSINLITENGKLFINDEEYLTGGGGITGITYIESNLSIESINGNIIIEADKDLFLGNHTIISNTFTLSRLSNLNISGEQNITLDFNVSSDFYFTLNTDTNLTLNNPINTSRIGQQGSLIFYTSDTGHKLNWFSGGKWYFNSGFPPTFSGNDNTIDIFSYMIVEENIIIVNDNVNFQQY